VTLRLKDSGPAVKALQAGLNKLGSLLLVDGHFGNGTADAIQSACPRLNLTPRTEGDDEVVKAVKAFPDPFPALTAAGLTFIARFEVSGAREYSQKYTKPIWPKLDSGITIGIGYDLRFVNASQLQQDWGAVLPAAACAALSTVCGKPGSPELLKTLNVVAVPFDVAMTVYVSRTLPEFVRRTAGIYPQLMTLKEHQRAALVSLVYNRGTSFKDNDAVKQNRREMRTIRDLLAAGKLDEVPAQLDSMTRLWDPASGLVGRRRNEALLWKSGFEALQLA